MTDSLSAIFAALADPTRRAILARLRQGDASVADLSGPFAMTPQAVSKHVGVLERAGLVSRRRKAQRNVSRLEAAPLREIEEWIEAYREQWESRFDKVEDVIARIRKGEIDDPRR